MKYLKENYTQQQELGIIRGFYLEERKKLIINILDIIIVGLLCVIVVLII